MESGCRLFVFTAFIVFIWFSSYLLTSNFHWKSLGSHWGRYCRQTLSIPTHTFLFCLPSGPAASQFSLVQSLSRVRLCDPMNRSTPGLPVHHQLPEFTQTHVHRVSDAIQPSHPPSSPSPPAPNPSQHQSLFQWVNSSHEVAKVLEFQL